MTSDQITSALAKLYTGDGHRIVFWNDPDREFVDFVSKLELEGVNRVHLDDGVKVNCAKFGPLLADTKKVCGTKDD